MRKLAIFAAGFALAAALYVYVLNQTLALWLTGLGLLAALVFRRLSVRRAAIAALGLTVGLLWTLGYDRLWLGPTREYIGENLPVEAEVLAPPRQTGWGSGADVRLQVGSHTCDAVLYAGEGLGDCMPGDVIACVADGLPASRSLQNREKLYAMAAGKVLILTADQVEKVGSRPMALSMRLHLWLQSRIDHLYSGDTAAFLRAILTGDRSGLTYELRTAFSLSGISHVIAVSGMHLSLMVLIAGLLCFGNPRLTAILGSPLVILFALMTGASPSVCRAAVMQCILLCAPLAKRQSDRPTTLLAALLVLLLQNPWAIASISLQMSFAAVAGLFLFAAPMQEKLLPKGRKHSRMARSAALTVSSTFSASLLTLPLCWIYFGSVSLAAPVTNVLVLWAVGLIMPLGLLSLVLGPVGALLSWPVRLLCSWVLTTARVLAAFPYASATPQNGFLMAWAIGVFALGLWWSCSKRRVLPSYINCALLAALICSILAGRAPLLAGPGAFMALDVGQGQCLILQLGDFTAMVDCGGSDAREAGELAAHTLRSAGITRVDALILTHFDRDHVGGVPYFLDQMQADAVYYPEAEDRTGTRDWLQARDLPGHAVTDLTEFSFPQGKLTIYPPVSSENDNNSGVCVLATASEYDILITGDLDQMAELRLLSRWKLPPVEVLVAGHHGASNATSALLLEQVQPEQVLISAGKGNRYGHPNPDTLERLRAAGAEVHRTDSEGTILLKP